jgi:hypothetical protein
LCVDFASKHMLARKRYVKGVDVLPKIPGCRELLFTWQYNFSVAGKEVSKVLRPYFTPIGIRNLRALFEMYAQQEVSPEKSSSQR